MYGTHALTRTRTHTHFHTYKRAQHYTRIHTYTPPPPTHRLSLSPPLSLSQVVTLTQAVFEGTPNTEPIDCAVNGTAGCRCSVGTATGLTATGTVPQETCASTFCFEGRCSHERVESVLGVDFLYKTFETRILEHTAKAPDGASGRSCGSQYTCADGTSCVTECYVLDDSARLVSL